MPKKKKVKKFLQDYISKIKKPPTPQLPLPPLNSLPSKNWILSPCKHPKTRSFAIDRDRNGDVNGDTATLAGIDRFLFENFKSLYIKRNDDEDEYRDISRHTAGKQRDEGECNPFGDIVLFDSPRLINPPLKLRNSKRFFMAPGSSGRSLMEEARSSLTTSGDVGSSSTSSTTNTVTTTTNTITSSMDLAPNNEIVGAEKKVKVPNDCVAVVTTTQCPYTEFKRSMQEVVESCLGGAVDWEFMEEMLLCYLDLNDRKSHKYILSAFVGLFVSLHRDPNNRVTSASRDGRSNSKSNNNVTKSFGQNVGISADVLKEIEGRARRC